MAQNKIPRHIGIIMDGNRRWAKKRYLPSVAGHEEGSKRVEPLVEHAAKKGVTHLTLWAFSTENWKRNQEEVNELMGVFRQVLEDPMIPRLMKNGVRVNVIGDLTAFPEDIRKGVGGIIEKSRENTRIMVNFALNYGGLAEVVSAIHQMIKDGIKDVSEETIFDYLYTKGQPNPDFIIRTGGEKRLSGFLPLQSVYSELYFAETYWPDFTPEEFDKALDVYAERERRFGK